MSEIDVRLIDGQAEETVLNRIAEIEAGAYSVPWDAASLADTLRYDHNFVIIAYDGESIAGYLIFNLIMDQSELLRITVDEAYRRAGIGRKLMESYTEEIKSIAESSLLEVRAANVPAIALYESCGYERLATRKNYYSEPVEDAIVMSLTF